MINKESKQLKGILTISKKKIFIDIDGVITNESYGFDYLNRTPNLETIKTINRLYKKNYIVLYSARYKEDMDITINWMKKHKVSYHEIILGKPQYDYFIDDKAYNSFGDLNKKIKEI